MLGPVVVVGEALSRAADDREALSVRTYSGRRLMRLLGVDQEGYDRIGRTNLLPHRATRWGSWHRRRAALAAGRIVAAAASGTRLVLLGRNVAAAFGLASAATLGTYHVGGLAASLLPHPSGLSHWWNDPANVLAATEFVASLSLVGG